MPLLESTAKIKELVEKWKEINQSQQSPIKVLNE